METTWTKQLKVEPPFVSDFGGFAIIEKGDWLVCPDKKVGIHIPALKSAVVESNKNPINKKFVVGVTLDSHKEVHFWRDELNTNIGCLHEQTSIFNKKYQKLIKHLNK